MKNILSIRRLEKLFYICLIIFSVYACVNALINSTKFVNRPFPGFLLLNNMMISQVSLEHWTINSNEDVNSYDKVLAVNGRDVQKATELYDVVANSPEGTSFTYKLENNNEIYSENVPSVIFKTGDYIEVFFIQFIVGLIILLTGIIVFALKPEFITSKILLLFCICVANWFVLDFDYQTTFSLVYDVNLAYLFQIFTPGLVIILAFVFPKPIRLFEKYKELMLVPVLFSLSLFLLQNHFKGNPVIWEKLDTVLWLYIAVSTLFLTSYLAYGYYNSEDPLYKQRALVALIGSGFGFFAPAALAFFFVLFGYVNINFLTLPLLFFPVSLAYAIVKHKLFDIEIIFQKVIVNALLIAAVCIFFFISLMVFNALFSSQFGWNNPVFLLLLSAFFVLTINPLRNYIQDFIDDTLFRKRYDYTSTISELSDAMISMLNVDMIAKKLTDTINHAMALDSESLYIADRDTGDFVLYSSLNTDSGTSSKHIDKLKSDNPLIDYLYMVKSEIFIEDIESENKFRSQKDTLLKIFHDLNASLVFPLFFKDDLRGVLILGRKRTGQMFNSMDIKLLSTLVNQTAIAIENSFSFELVEDYANELEKKNQILKNIQEQLIHTEKMSAIGQLAAGIAHEIRNPLNIIEGARYYLASQLENGNHDGSVNDYLEYIQNEVIRTNRLIDQLLNFAKIDHGKSEQVNINNIIENVLVLSRKQIQDAGVKLHKDLNEEVPEVKGDSGQLWQVLINLLMNSIQSIDKDGEISIESGILQNYFNSGSDYVYTKITDNGSGIDEQDLPRIFDPFFTKKASGTGLGLSVSYKIIESHKGNILVSSRVGEGTSFILQLPLDNTAEV